MPRELPKFSYLIIAIVFGILVGIGLFKLSSKGLLNFKFNNLSKIEVPQIQKTQIVLSEENIVIKVVEEAIPSVVTIGTSKNATIGTGFIVSEKGIVITNKHLVAGNDIYNVVTLDGKKFEVRKIYRDPILDLAVIQIDEGGLKALEIGNSSNLKIGQTVITVGNIVTTGVVSKLGTQINTDAVINSGNSGGPLLNTLGQVIGVNVATNGVSQNIGIAISIDSVKKIINDFINKGAVSKPVLGIKYNFTSKEFAILNKQIQGAYVQEVVAGSSAEKAGIKVGDIITKINGSSIDNESQINEVIFDKKVGDILTLNIWNNGKEKIITATLQDLIN